MYMHSSFICSFSSKAYALANNLAIFNELNKTEVSFLPYGIYANLPKSVYVILLSHSSPWHNLHKD